MQSNTCQWKLFRRHSPVTKNVVQYDTCTVELVSQNICIVEDLPIWTNMTNRVSQHEMGQYGHVSKELLFRMSRANQETCRMKFCNLNARAVCHYGHIAYEFSYSISTSSWYTCHTKVTVLFYVYMWRRLIWKFGKCSCWVKIAWYEINLEACNTYVAFYHILFLGALHALSTRTIESSFIAIKILLSMYRRTSFWNVSGIG